MSRLLDKDIVGYAHELAAAYSDHPDRDAIAVNVADWMVYTLSAFGYYYIDVGDVRTIHDLRVEHTERTIEDSAAHMREIMRHVGRIELPDHFAYYPSARLNFIERLIGKIVSRLFFTGRLNITVNTVVAESVRRIYGSVAPSLTLDIPDLLDRKNASAYDDIVVVLQRAYPDNPWLALNATDLIFSFLAYRVPVRDDEDVASSAV